MTNVDDEFENEGKMMTPEEKEALLNYLSQTQGAPLVEEKLNVHVFLNKVATSDDTTKVGYLEITELGTPTHPVRSFKEYALISRGIIGNEEIGKFFDKESEIVTATSLSREGFLVKQATTTTRQIADVSKIRKPNKGWFKKKDAEEPKMIE